MTNLDYKQTTSSFSKAYIAPRARVATPDNYQVVKIILGSLMAFVAFLGAYWFGIQVMLFALNLMHGTNVSLSTPMGFYITLFTR